MATMAQAVEMTHHDVHAAGTMPGLLGALQDAWQRRRIYRRTYAELNALSTRELSDLGISRSMISRLAQEAADGQHPLF